jgi:molecular chaperone GrpE
MSKKKDKVNKSEEKNDINLEEFMLLKQKNDEVTIKLTEYEEIIKRQQAEFDNYRKRVLKEKEDYISYAGVNIFKDLIDSLDNFHRALEIKVEDDSQKSFFNGFKMIYDQINGLLEKYNVLEIEGIEKEFNPNLHQAIAFEDSDDIEHDQVCEIFQKGYILKERVIRAATVKIKKASKVIISNVDEVTDKKENVEMKSSEENVEEENLENKINVEEEKK